MDKMEHEIEKIEKGNAWDESDEVFQVEVHKPLDKVIPIRLAADKWEALRQEARDAGIGPTTLARVWILERLRQSEPHAAWRRNIISVLKTAETQGSYVSQRYLTPDELAKKMGIRTGVRRILRKEYPGQNRGKYGRWHIPQAVADWIAQGRTGPKPKWNN